MSHSKLDPIIELPQVRSDETTLEALLEIARARLGPEAMLEFSGELVVAMHCTECGQESAVFKRMARLYDSSAICPECGARREMILTHRITGEEDYLNRTLAQVDVPPLDIIRARNDEESVYYELTGDKDTFLHFE